MSRRKTLAQREASGRVKRNAPQLPSPIEVVRLRDAALMGLRDSIWGSTLCWLFLTGKIDGAMFAAGKHWLRLVADYDEACLAPREPGTVALDPEGGTPADPDSPRGRRQARRHVFAVEDYEQALAVLKRCPAGILAVVEAICEQGRLPEPGELLALRIGLSALVETQMGQRV